MRSERRPRGDIFRHINPGPRARLAARLYASGAVPTKRAACEAVGLSPSYLTVLKDNEKVKNIIGEVDRALEDKTVALSGIVALMSRKALSRVNDLIESANEHVAMKASSDILDRNPETSKTFKASITSFSLDSADVKELAASLVAAARVKEKYLPVAASDFIKVEDLLDGEAKDGSSPQADAGEEAPSGVRGQSAPREATQGTQEERGDLT